MAQEGLWFKNAYSQGTWTSPSMASIFTSQYPPVFMISPSQFQIPDSFSTLAERFRSYGYDTIALNSNWLVNKPDAICKDLTGHISFIIKSGFIPTASAMIVAEGRES
jgi:arylsulfatase A-like enzyme